MERRVATLSFVQEERVDWTVLVPFTVRVPFTVPRNLTTLGATPLGEEAMVYRSLVVFRRPFAEVKLPSGSLFRPAKRIRNSPLLLESPPSTLQIRPVKLVQARPITLLA